MRSGLYVARNYRKGWLSLKTVQPLASPPVIRSIRFKSTQTPQDSPNRPLGRIVFSGIQPTGIPHLGNYLGALRPWVNLQNNRRSNDEFNFSVVDLHALTVPQDSVHFREWRRDTYAALVAVGLDPRICNIFFQSEVPEHSELMWILSTIASTGYLSRMTQWKSKLDLPENTTVHNREAKSSLKLGLFSYPVLQAADILLYKTTHVPIGEDQQQHIEFARTLAAGFNHIYGDVLSLPEPVISPARRIMSLTDPRKKMSKSDANPSSRILITDDRDTIKKKINSTLTDSYQGITYDPETRPGVSNLIDILKYAKDEAMSSQELAADFKDTSLRSLKDAVSCALDETLEEIRDRFLSYRSTSNGLEKDKLLGQCRASSSASRTLREVKEAMGLR